MTESDLLRPDGSPVHVLVVDDEENIAELVGMALRYEGWQTTVANNGTQAVNKAKQVKPDAVVLDMMLPDFDGMEAMRRIRASLEDAFMSLLQEGGPEAEALP